MVVALFPRIDINIGSRIHSFYFPMGLFGCSCFEFVVGGRTAQAGAGI